MIFLNLDLNDQTNLDLYFKILMFKDDGTRNELQLEGFARSKQMIIHLISESFNLEYEYSAGTVVAKISRSEAYESRTIDAEGTIDSAQEVFHEPTAIDFDLHRGGNDQFPFGLEVLFLDSLDRDPLTDFQPDPFLSNNFLDLRSNI